MKKRIITIVGARPQFIKAAVLSRSFQESSVIEEVLVHTGQHFDDNMSAVFFEELQIPSPHHLLHIQGGHHGQMTGRMIEAIEKILLQEKPDAVLVYGDTNSTLAGALAAVKLHIPLIHVEAGLRSYNRQMPEEVNRVLTDHMSSLLLCPTKSAVENLRKEGITENVHHTGDIMYDATSYAFSYLKKHPIVHPKFNFLGCDFVLMTVHRAESTDCPETFKAIMEFAEQFAFQTSLKIVFPIHPRTKKLIDQNALLISDSFIILDPLSYLQTQYLLSKAQYVLTDSGGLQKEAYFHQIPCITLRTETEWIETIQSGWNRLWTVDHYEPRRSIEDYGKGNCAPLMVDLITRSIV